MDRTRKTLTGHTAGKVSLVNRVGTPHRPHLIRLLTAALLMIFAATAWATLSTATSAGALNTALPGKPDNSKSADVPQCGPNWVVVTSPNIGANDNYLRATAGISSSDAWAVGYYNNGTANQTLATHWDGSSWSVVTTPNVGSSNNSLNGIAAISANNAWAVGHSTNGALLRTLIMHWDGSTWNIVTSPNLGSDSNTLSGVTAVSANDVWAVGFYADGGNRTLIMHWDGSGWSTVSSPNVGSNSNYLSSVDAVSPNDIWTVGYYFNGSTNRTLILHWDGSTWSIVTSPNTGNNQNYLNAITVVSANDVWAVGYYYTGTKSQTLIERWDGNGWSLVASPNVGAGSNTLNGVASIYANNVLAVGNNAGTHESLIEKWDGNQWDAVTSPNVGTNANPLNAVAAVADNDLWAVGVYSDGSTARTMIQRFNPCSGPPTATPTSTPSPTNTPGGSTPTPTACPIQFSDVPTGSTFHSNIICLACRGIISGYPDGTFRPNNNITRGQLAKIVSNAAEFDDIQATELFQDVPSGSTFFDFVGRLASRGIMAGYPCGGDGEPCGPASLPYFRPNLNATRGQISKIVSSTAGFADAQPDQLFQDVPSGDTFHDFVGRLASRGIMSGYPCGNPGEPCGPGNLPYFRPQSNATRGQTSKIVANTFFPGCVTP